MIELTDITLRHGHKTVFEDFNLHIKPKERLVVLGASGSGKSTLLRLIAGLVTPTHGTVKIEGKIATQDTTIHIPPHERMLTMIFQDLALWPHFSVGDNIAYGLKIQKVPPKTRQEKVEDTLNLVGLSGYTNRSIATLSGGEQQRVAIARALVLSPKILLMDEPFSSLDETRNQSLCQEIVCLQEKFNFTLIHVTHNEAEAKRIGTRFFRV